MGVGIWVLNDQLDQAQAALSSSAPGDARVVLVESEALLRKRPHRQKQILFWSAQRHFAEELMQAGWQVDLEGARRHQNLLLWRNPKPSPSLRNLRRSPRPFPSLAQNHHLRNLFPRPR